MKKTLKRKLRTVARRAGLGEFQTRQLVRHFLEVIGLDKRRAVRLAIKMIVD